MSFEPILLAPEEEVEEIYPYRRVWRTAWLEVSIVFLAVGTLLGLDAFGLQPAVLDAPAFKIGMAILPLIIWLTISYRGERVALQPRRHLGGVMLLGALVASGVAIPLEDQIFTPARWLPNAGFFGRVLGYAFTIGFTAEFLKYAALRYTVWPHHIHQRLDGVAYALAIAVGYATVLNLRFAALTDSTLIATALRVASYSFSHLAVGAILGFFLAELVIGRVPIFWLPLGLGIASLLSGLYYAFRVVAIVGGLNQFSTGARPVRGLALAVSFVAVAFIALAFIIESADTRMATATRQSFADYE